jgi:hypothetical protein
MVIQLCNVLTSVDVHDAFARIFQQLCVVVSAEKELLVAQTSLLANVISVRLCCVYSMVYQCWGSEACYAI